MIGINRKDIQAILKAGAKTKGMSTSEFKAEIQATIDNIKSLQYIMGHAHIDVTMDVYNHVSEMSRIESEITRLKSVAIS